MVVMSMLGWSSSVQVRGFMKQCRGDPISNG